MSEPLSDPSKSSLKKLARRYAIPFFLSLLALWLPWIVYFRDQWPIQAQPGIVSAVGFWLAIPTFAPVLLTLFNRIDILNDLPSWLESFMTSSFEAMIEGRLSWVLLTWVFLSLGLLACMTYLAARSWVWLIGVLIIVLLLEGYPIFLLTR